jgi:hypothetical protein
VSYNVSLTLIIIFLSLGGIAPADGWYSVNSQMQSFNKFSTAHVDIIREMHDLQVCVQYWVLVCVTLYLTAIAAYETTLLIRNIRIIVELYVRMYVQGFPDNSVAAVYASHTLEHNSFGDGKLETTLKGNAL